MQVRTLGIYITVFMRNTRLSGRNQANTVATMSHRTTHYRENSFFARTARLWNNLPADIFPECFNISVFKARVNQHFLLPLLLSNLCIYPSTLSFPFKPMQCNAFIGVSPAPWLCSKKKKKKKLKIKN